MSKDAAAIDSDALLSTEDFITELFVRVDEAMRGLPKDPRAKLWPGEVVTLALLFAIKGSGERGFYRWLVRDWRKLFPRLPERTRLFRLFAAHRAWTDRFLADATFFGVADSYGIELIHPRREGRSAAQVGRKTLSNGRWIVGGKLGVVLNGRGLVCAWDAAAANAYDANAFHHLVARFADRMIVLADNNFHGGRRCPRDDPPNLKVCQHKTWGERMVVETMLSMLTVVCRFKKVTHRAWRYFVARLAYTMAAFNVLVQWHGLPLKPDGRYHPSIAPYGL
jgi:hypothetical protein